MNKETGAITFQTFGEHTTIPVAVRQAVVHISDPPVDFVQKSVALLKLNVANETVKKDVSSKLRLTLPAGASVKRFELLRNDQWIPATAVPKKKSKEIVYKEKEKGRDVAAVSNVGSGSNVFEIEVSPLPYRVQVRLSLELLVDTRDVESFANSLFPKGSSTKVSIEKTATNLVTDFDAVGVSNDSLHGGVAGGAVVGECFGRTHFVCKVPHIDSTPNSTRNPPIRRVAVAWDTSSSMLASKQQIQTRCARLKELLDASNAQCEGSPSPVLELFSFATDDPERIGVYNDVNGLARALESIDYDGGTNLTTLPKLTTALASHEGDGRVDCMFVFTDGMDNLGRTPTFVNSYDIDFPIHCVADGKGEINMRCLRSIASTCPSHPGVVFTKRDRSYIPGVLSPLPMLRSIKTDQDEEALTGEVDDGFRCVPDYRVKVLNQPIDPDGMLIVGILKEDGKEVSVSKLIAEVSVGGEMHEFHFKLQNTIEACPVDIDNGKDGRKVTLHHCQTVHMQTLSDSGALNGGPSRILGHLYAEYLYAEAECYGLKSGMNVDGVRESLAIQYGFCSPESSLLMLYEADQFIEYGVLPPQGHPVCEDDRIVALSRKRVSEQQAPVNPKLGDIGGKKNQEQTQNLLVLGRKFKQYFATPWSPPEKKKRVPCETPRPSTSTTALPLPSNLSPTSARARRILRQRGELKDEFMANMSCFASVDDGAFVGAVEFEEFCDDRSEEESDERSEEESDEACELEWRDDDVSDGEDDHVQLQGSRGRGRSVHMEGGLRSDIGDYGVVTPTLGKPDNPNEYMDKLDLTLQESAGNEKSWRLLYNSELQRLGGYGSVSPSFFLNTARMLVSHNRTKEASKVACNCLETGLEDVQMLRSVGYALISTQEPTGLELAVAVFDKVIDLEPCEPQSYMDAALCRFLECRRRCVGSPAGNEGDLADHIKSSVAKSQDLLSHVLKSQWASRFEEIEWPALVLLHYLADFVTERTTSTPSMAGMVEWPAALKDAFRNEDDNCCDTLRCSDFDPALCIWLGWDTDKTDVDLHVTEPSGQLVYYSNRRGKSGSLLSRDFTNGYGPEVYLLKDVTAKETKDARLIRQTRQMDGEFKVEAKYFASHQDSALTGATSAVVLTMTKATLSCGDDVSKSSNHDMLFRFVRLDTHKEKTHVATAKLSPGRR